VFLGRFLIRNISDERWCALRVISFASVVGANFMLFFLPTFIFKFSTEVAFQHSDFFQKNPDLFQTFNEVPKKDRARRRKRRKFD
jgi:hypothetical protein